MIPFDTFCVKIKVVTHDGNIFGLCPYESLAHTDPLGTIALEMIKERAISLLRNEYRQNSLNIISQRIDLSFVDSLGDSIIMSSDADMKIAIQTFSNMNRRVVIVANYDNDNIYNYDLPQWHHCNKNKRKSIDVYNYGAYLISLLEGRGVYNTESILEYIESHPVCAEQKNRDGNYPLHVACQYVNQNVIHDEDDNIIKKLIQLYKIAVTKPNDDGKLPLHIACNNGQSENAIIVLIEAFPDAANMSCVDNMTPLHYACSTVGSKVVIRQLIDIYPDALSQKDSFGNYPIHLAMESESQEADEIIEYIMDVDPLSIQRQNIRDESPLHMKYSDNIGLLLMEKMKNHADIILHMRDKSGMTPLHVACFFGKEYVVKCLLQYPGIDINDENKFKTFQDTAGMMPLHYACYNGKDSVVEILLQNPCINVNVKEVINNSTPLHLAMFEPSRVSIVEKLIAHPFISINTKDNNNETALDMVKHSMEQVKTMDNSYDDESDDDSIENKEKLLSDYQHIQMLLEEFPMKRRWQAYMFILSKAELV